MGIGLVFIVEESEKDMLISFVGKNSCSKIGVVILVKFATSDVSKFGFFGFIPDLL